MPTTAAPTPFVSFDLDGCLVDSTVAVATAMNHALSSIGIATLPPSDLVANVGPPLEIYARRILEKLGEPNTRGPALMAAYLDAYAQRLTQDTTVFPGIVDQLELLDEFELAVVTMKRESLAVRLLEHLDLKRFFVSVHGSTGGEPGKLPLLRAIMDTRGFGPAVMVGDTPDDVLAGQAVGMGTLAVTWGFGERTDLQAARPDAVIDRVDALGNALRDVLAHAAPAPSPGSGIT